MSFSLACWGRPSGCIMPKPLGPDPVACIFLHLPKLICLPCLICLSLSPARLHPPRVHPFIMQFACALKGGLLSIATQELLLALQPSPPGLDHGIATWHTSGGELARGPGPEDVECLHLTALQGHTVTKTQDQAQPALR